MKRYRARRHARRSALTRFATPPRIRRCCPDQEDDLFDDIDIEVVGPPDDNPQDAT